MKLTSYMNVVLTEAMLDALENCEKDFPLDLPYQIICMQEKTGFSYEICYKMVDEWETHRCLNTNRNTKLGPLISDILDEAFEEN